jgi:hypothetical protein
MLLSAAVENNLLLRVRCQYCRIVRHYDPPDLMRIVGDVPFTALESRMTCSACRKWGYLTFRLVWLTAEERQRTKLRKPVEVKMVPKAVWRDE